MKIGTNKKEYNFVDVLKFFFMLCVIAIHCNIESIFGRTGWYILHCIFRLAVPFFFVASGFFFMSKLEKSGSRIEQTIKSYIRRILVPLLFYVTLNILLDVFLKIINNYQFSIKWFVRTIQRILFDPPGAMWFLSACIFGIIFLYPFLKRNKINLAIFIGIFLYSFALICNTYYYIIKDIPFFSSMIELYAKFFKIARNGLFVGFFDLAIGIKCYEINKKWNKQYNKIVCCISPILFLLLCAEIYFAEQNKQFLMDDHSLFIFLPYFIACIFLIALHIPFPKRQMSILRNLSSGMYFMHRFILKIISIGLIHLYPVFANSPITKFLLTTFLSFFDCMIGYKINNKKINLLIK